MILGTTSSAVDVLTALLRSYAAGQLPYDVSFEAIKVLDKVLWDYQTNLGAATGVVTATPLAPTVQASNPTVHTIDVKVIYPDVDYREIILAVVYRKGGSGPDADTWKIAHSRPTATGSNGILADGNERYSTFTDSGLEYGTEYTYKATFSLASGITSDESAPESETTLFPGIAPPSITELVSVSETSAKFNFSVDWAFGGGEGLAVAHVSVYHYAVDRSTLLAADTRSGLRGTVSSPHLAFTDTSLVAGSIYDYVLISKAAPPSPLSSLESSPKFRVVTLPKPPVLAQTNPGRDWNYVEISISPPTGHSALVAVGLRLYRKYETGAETAIYEEIGHVPSQGTFDSAELRNATDDEVLPGRVVLYSAEYAVATSFWPATTFSTSRRSTTLYVYSPPGRPALNEKARNATSATYEIVCPANYEQQYIVSASVYCNRTLQGTVFACKDSATTTFVATGPPGHAIECYAVLDGRYGTTSLPSPSINSLLPPSPPTLASTEAKGDRVNVTISLPTDGSDAFVTGMYLLRRDPNGDSVTVGGTTGPDGTSPGWFPGPGPWEVADTANVKPGQQYEYFAWLSSVDGLTSADSEPLFVWTPVSAPVVGYVAGSATAFTLSVIVDLARDGSAGAAITVYVYRGSILIQEFPADEAPVSIVDRGLDAGRGYNYTAVVLGQGQLWSEYAKPAEGTTIPPPPLLSPYSVTSSTCYILVSIPYGISASQVALYTILRVISANGTEFVDHITAISEPSTIFQDADRHAGTNYTYVATLRSFWGVDSSLSLPLRMTTAPEPPIISITANSEILPTHIPLHVFYQMKPGAEAVVLTRILRNDTVVDYGSASTDLLLNVSTVPGTLYEFIAYYEGFGGSISLNSSLIARSAPSPPSVRILSASIETMNLNIDFPTDGSTTDAKGIILERNGVAHDTVQPGPYTDRDTQPGTLYTYRAYIETVVEGVVSPWSPSVSNYSQIYAPIITVDNSTASPAIASTSVRVAIDYRTNANREAVVLVRLFRDGREVESAADLLTADSLTDSTATPGQQYTYHAQFNGPADIISDFSNPLVVVTPPSKPILSLVSASDDTIVLHIDPPSDGSAASPDLTAVLFLIRVYPNGTQSSPVLLNGDFGKLPHGLDHRDAGLDPGTGYVYEAFFEIATGVFSPYSDGLSAFTAPSRPSLFIDYSLVDDPERSSVTDTAAPLLISLPADGSARVAEGIIIYRNGSEVASRVKDQLSWEDVQLSPADLYMYTARLTTNMSTVFSPLSTDRTVVAAPSPPILGDPVPYPERRITVPVMVSTGVGSANIIAIERTDCYRKNPDGTEVFVTSLARSVYELNDNDDTDLCSGSTYQYWCFFRADDGNGRLTESGKSNVVSVTLQPSEPSIKLLNLPQRDPSSGPQPQTALSLTLTISDEESAAWTNGTRIVCNGTIIVFLERGQLAGLVPGLLPATLYECRATLQSPSGDSEPSIPALLSTLPATSPATTWNVLPGGGNTNSTAIWLRIEVPVIFGIEVRLVRVYRRTGDLVSLVTAFEHSAASRRSLMASSVIQFETIEGGLIPGKPSVYYSDYTTQGGSSVPSKAITAWTAPGSPHVMLVARSSTSVTLQITPTAGGSVISYTRVFRNGRELSCSGKGTIYNCTDSNSPGKFYEYQAQYRVRLFSTRASAILRDLTLPAAGPGE
eukprot:tig00021504_g21966.t1